MVVRVSTVAFEGIETRPVDVQVQISNGNVVFNVVGLGDKAVAELRERVRSALVASGLSLPAKRITVNLAPADMPKEGSHYDLPIALGVMAAIGAIPFDALDGFTVLGELALDGSVSSGGGRSPGGGCGQCAWVRVDMSRRLWLGSGVGFGRYSDPGASQPYPIVKPLPGNTSSFPPRAGNSGRSRRTSGSS